MIKFIEEGHKYINEDPEDNFEWISVTTLVGQFKEKFDDVKVAEKCSKGKNKKYKGKTVQEILDIWDTERLRSTDLGTWYHNQREKDVLDLNTITRDGIEVPIISPVIENGVKYSVNQSLTEGIYPELLVYLRSASICGQADRVEIINDTINVYDYKTNKEIKTRGFQFYDGTYKKMLGPLRHLEDCELTHYAIQLSIYMYIIHKHNFNLKVGKITIQHVTFEVESLDHNGYPVLATDASGEPIIKGVEDIEVPYMKKEVINILKWLKINKKIILHDAH